ncbi:MAG TPA: glycosyltransferase family 4 protein [Azospirillum sp.]|nr:glycosyltransferase family 4 protein [Azospirillum sp.]
MSAPELHLVIPGPLAQNTGGYRFDRRVVEGLRGRGWTVHVHELPGSYPHVDASAILAAGIALSRLPDRALTLVDGLAIPGLAAAMSLDQHRLRMVALVHHPLWLESGYDDAQATALRNLEQGALACTRRILVPSRATARDVAGMGIPEAAVAVIPPGTDPAAPATGSADGIPTLLNVGILTPRKGHLMLVEALSGLKELPWRLIVVGGERDAVHAAFLRAAIERVGLSDRVELHGDVDETDLAAAFAGADLFVQASQHEGYGMAVAEALAHGLPVVATAVGAVPELVPDGAGLLAPPNDAPALAEALRRVLSDAELRRRLGKGARTAAAALPTWDACIDRFVEELAAL